MNDRRVLALFALLTLALLAETFLVPAYGILLDNVPLLVFLVVLLLLNFRHEANGPDQPWVDRPGEEE